jgi:short-subunit dehydrogenase
MSKRNISGIRAIVTGASSGIGFEIAKQLVAGGGNVVCVARRQDRLDALIAEVTTAHGPNRIIGVTGDLTVEAIRTQAIQTAQERFGGLDLLVNNAGVGAMGPFESSDPKRVRTVMEVNFFALVEMTRAALPLLHKGRKPMIVNISSILGHRGVPHNSEYCASKFAVHGFSEALRSELAAEGIDVLIVSPGTTETEFFDSVVEKTGAPRWPRHAGVTAAQVARETIRAITRGSHEIIPYRWGKVLVALNRLSPWLVDKLMARYA